MCVCVCTCVWGGEEGVEGGEGERCLFNTGDTGNSPLGRPNHITGGAERQQKIIVNVTYDTSSKGLKQLSRYG